jgi:hypothetical protein
VAYEVSEGGREHRERRKEHNPFMNRSSTAIEKTRGNQNAEFENVQQRENDLAHRPERIMAEVQISTEVEAASCHNHGIARWIGPYAFVLSMWPRLMINGGWIALVISEPF